MNSTLEYLTIAEAARLVRRGTWPVLQAVRCRRGRHLDSADRAHGGWKLLCGNLALARVGLLLALGAAVVTVWAIVDFVARKHQTRVSELAQIMARVAEEDRGP
jgi:hypothetical protein